MIWWYDNIDIIVDEIEIDILVIDGVGLLLVEQQQVVWFGPTKWKIRVIAGVVTTRHIPNTGGGLVVILEYIREKRKKEKRKNWKAPREGGPHGKFFCWERGWAQPSQIVLNVKGKNE